MLTELKHELGKKLAKNYGQMCSQTPDDERYSAIDSGLYSLASKWYRTFWVREWISLAGLQFGGEWICFKLI